jgi:hypothetical protein
VREVIAKKTRFLQTSVLMCAKCMLRGISNRLYANSCSFVCPISKETSETVCQTNYCTPRTCSDLLDSITISGSDVNAQGGYFGNALQAASLRGHMKIVKLLADIDIDLNAHGGCFCNAQEAALIGGHLRVAGLLQYWRARQRLSRVFNSAIGFATHRSATCKLINLGVTDWIDW